MGTTIQTMLEAAMAGNRVCLARLLSQIERSPAIESELRRALSGIEPKAVVVGVTGPPGAGKSTLISTLLAPATDAMGQTAVLAIDPSSPFSGGALLGDRVRMQSHGLGNRVFIRSMASRGESGGLARTTATAVQLLDACGWPLIILETLGIGQVELDVMDLATVVMVVLNPGWGDTFQANKAGLTEAGDVFVINKADKEGAAQTRSDLKDSLALLQSPLPISIFDTVATKQQGIDELWCGIEQYLSGARELGLLSQKQAERRRRLLLRILERDLLAYMQQYLGSDLGSQQVSAVLSGDKSIEALQADLLAHLSRAKNNESQKVL
jgi:LAO/AO transport system kinase